MLTEWGKKLCPSVQISCALVDVNPKWSSWVHALTKTLMQSWVSAPIDQKEEFSNSYLTKQYKIAVVEPLSKKPQFLCKVAAPNYKVAIYTCHHASNSPTSEEVGLITTLRTITPFSHYKWWVPGFVPVPKRQLLLLGNHKAKHHVPFGIVGSKGYQVPASIVQPLKIFEVQQAALVALVSRWNSTNYIM